MRKSSRVALKSKLLSISILGKCESLDGRTQKQTESKEKHKPLSLLPVDTVPLLFGCDVAGGPGGLQVESARDGIQIQGFTCDV